MTPLVASWIASAAAMLLVSLDSEFQYQWIALFIWLTSVVTPALYFFRSTRCQIPAGRILGRLRDLSRQDIGAAIVVVLFSIPYFMYLNSYPFLPIWDEVRDGGINVRQILDHALPNLFLYGRYNSHGLIIPTLLTPFYKIFGNSPLTYRVPSAILSVLTGWCVFLIGRKAAGPKAGVFAAAVLLSSALQLHFGRTEFVVISSIFLTAFIIWSMDLLELQAPTLPSLGVLSLLCGFVAGFHTSVRAVALLALLYMIFLCWRRTKQSADNRWKTVRSFLAGTGILLASFVSGFGPRILFTPLSIFLQSRSLGFSSQNPNPPTSDLAMPTAWPARVWVLVTRYIESVGLYFGHETLSLHFPVATTLIPVCLNWLVFFGAI